MAISKCEFSDDVWRIFMSAFFIAEKSQSVTINSVHLREALRPRASEGSESSFQTALIPVPFSEKMFSPDVARILIELGERGDLNVPALRDALGEDQSIV